MPNIVSAGENSILIYFGDKIDASLPKNIANFANQLKNEMGGVVINLIPSYNSLHVSYDLNVIDYQDFVNQVEQCLKQNQNTASALESKTIRIPVYYGLEVGLDLERLLQEKNLDLDAFINVHSSKEYLVYAIGFSPVFAFLGEVDERYTTTTPKHTKD